MALSSILRGDNILSIENEAITTIAKELNKAIKTMLNKAHFDRTKKGRIINHIEGKYYEVQLGNQTYKAYSPFFSCNENDIVYVKIAENNYDNLIIECIIK